jgi:hypothetical protein
MQKQRSLLEGRKNLRFSVVPFDSRSFASYALHFVVTGALFIQWCGGPNSHSYSVAISLICLFLISFSYFNGTVIEFDFGKRFYLAGSSGGPFSDIRCLSIAPKQEPTHSTLFEIDVNLEFYPEAMRKPIRLDELTSSIPAAGLDEKILLYLDLAARLNVPVYDSSGWNGWRSPIANPPQIIIQPGETHPALLQPPPKPIIGKKW